jgi:hypothetical protein
VGSSEPRAGPGRLYEAVAGGVFFAVLRDRVAVDFLAAADLVLAAGFFAVLAAGFRVAVARLRVALAFRAGLADLVAEGAVAAFALVASEALPASAS